MRALGPPGTQAHQRIDREGQRLELDLDLFDGLGRRDLVDRRDRQDRLTLVDRLVRERDLAIELARDHLAVVVHGVGRLRQVVGRENRLDAGHRHRRARVEARHPRVRHAGSAGASRRSCPPRESPRRTCDFPVTFATRSGVV